VKQTYLAKSISQHSSRGTEEQKGKD